MILITTTIANKNVDNFLYFSVTKCKFDFAIMAAGFKSKCLPHLKYFNEPINIPSLHIFGEADQVIPTGKNIIYIFFLFREYLQQ